ncbi:MAG: phosphate signaling complex protein PhoU [Desulfobacterales bacterium]|nr:phosphate signaling complex protein PhoU [Deltaproteobacteria bacterium]MBT8360854.1 phosphate signaling complex protein PhoU [Deltaproteobacteria bacterium]NNK12643.1 phosphate signaling complex protein PhoU [Desulfofustis sp.]NNK96028.1 phosphate signaling complex protein PhoU [Desulfobacterales bacterium]
MQPHYTFHIELQNLNKKLLSLTALVEDRVRKATTLIVSQDQDLMQQIIRSDYEIDEMEIEIEEDCLKILALHQPVASDLRFIVAVIKINSDLERIADIAVNIANRVQAISQSPSKHLVKPIDFSSMSQTVISMLRKSLDALVHRDVAMARSVFLEDDAVDSYRNQIYHEIKDIIRKHPEHPGALINTYLIARHLERMADWTTNISEEVIYLVEGVISRTIS